MKETHFFTVASAELKLSEELQPYLEDAASVGFPTHAERIVIVACKRIAKMRAQIDKLGLENDSLRRDLAARAIAY